MKIKGTSLLVTDGGSDLGKARAHELAYPGTKLAIPRLITESKR